MQILSLQKRKLLKNPLAFSKGFIYNDPQLERWQSGNAADC